MISIVVPTRNRPERLRALLRSLPLDSAEVIVAAEGHVDAPGATVVRRPPGLGAAAARNLGWRAAQGEYVAFIDDDCLAAPGWLEALTARAAPDTIVQGRVAPDPDEAHRIGPFARTVHVDAAGPYFQTANILYPRALLERLDGFDESYAGVAGEDTDLGWRGLEAGARPVFAPDALVWHAVEEFGAIALARHAQRWWPVARTVRRHPGLRRHLHHRIFWKESHERLLLALGAIALSRRTRGVSLLACIPWALAHRGEHPSKKSLVTALPAHLLVDGSELAAMVRGSAAAGTVLL